MKTIGKTLKAAIPLTILTAALSTGSFARDQSERGVTGSTPEESSVPRALPEKSFGCQVQAKNGIQGLVMVQTDNRKMAFEAASNSMAQTLNGKMSPTISVVQCVEFPKEQFTDSTFQQFFGATPR